ncbi:MAG: LysM peptidoglycan-binding domain-containing protein [Anaerolineales bacterium]|nr:LysM peptidoglycan-binding domain-containing protein [Anaerolineales bacterium]
MSGKNLICVFILVSLLLTMLGTPSSAHAGGYCGSTYTVQWGDTLSSIAYTCGTTVSAIYAANPGLGYYLYAGQVLVMPGYNDCCAYTAPYTSTSGTHRVQYGETFSQIASWYGVSVYDLWLANQYILDINLLYVGQVIYLPGYASTAPVYYTPVPYYPTAVPTATEPPSALSWGTVPSGTPYGRVKLTNKSGASVYVSLQGTTSDGVKVINEYPVGGRMSVKVPAALYWYVAWVGGQSFTGSFRLSASHDLELIFYNNKVVVK